METTSIVDDYGTVEERPHVGDGNVILATCGWPACKWVNTYKGLTMARAHRALVSHFEYKHRENP